MVSFVDANEDTEIFQIILSRISMRVHTYFNPDTSIDLILDFY